MIPQVKTAKYVSGFTIHLLFTDGTEGEIDLYDELYGDMFEPLKDRTFFSRVTVHPDFHTLCWPNGADFAPEFLYDKLQVLT